MEALPWVRESKHLFGNNEDIVDGYVEASGEDNTSESSNAKRKIESLFCVMRKRICRHNSVDDDTFPDFDKAEKGDYGDDILNCLGPECDFRFENLMDNPYDSMDEGFMVGDFSCSDTDTDLSESSEFDIISEHVLEDKDLLTGLTLQSIWPSEEGTMVSKCSVETQSSKEDGVSVVSASPKELQRTFFPQICYGHHNDISLFHSEWKIDKMSCIPGLCEDIRCSVSKEFPEIPCNSDIFKNDGDKSSAIEVMYRSVVNMEGSMVKICSNDELILWKKDDEPIPISIVPPDDWSNLLLETSSINQIDRYNIHDDNIGPEISPTPLRKSLERPSRPWLVCGSIAAVRNLSLGEGSSGACSSLNEQLYENVSSTEDMDAELAQIPSTLYQEEVDGEDEMSFSDIDAMIRRLNLVPDDSDSCINRKEWNKSNHPRHTLLELEHCTRTSMRKALVSQRALAVLHCRDSKHSIRKREVIIGRSSDGLNVDIDLGKYGYGSKISRRQALVKLENYGSFTLKNLGKQHIFVNGEKLDTQQTVNLTSCSSIEIRGITFVFKTNKEAMKHLLKNNSRKKSEVETKFRWCL